MYIFQNALKNIGRNKGRNLLMGVIILVIIIAAVVSLAINNTSSKIIDNYKMQFGTMVSISPDLQKMYSEGPNFKGITPEQYMDFAKSKYLQQTTFSVQIPGISDSVKAIDQDNGPQNGQISVQGAEGQSQQLPTMKLIGNSSFNSLAEFSNGQRKITEGRIYKNINECIVSKEFADLNHIHVGDTIKINSIMGDNIQYPLKVTGIYLDATSEYGNVPGHMSFMNRRNEILTSFDTIMSDPKKAAGIVQIQATYYLKNPDLLSQFKSELRAKGLPSSYNATTDQANYNKIVGPVESMKSIFLTFMMVVLVLGFIILALLSSIAIRERKYEIGVLRAMGMKKGKVALGFIFESIIITALCLVLGLGIGSALSQPTANTILHNQIKSAEDAASSSGIGNQMVSGQTNISMSSSNAKPISKINVELNNETFGEIGLISLLLVIASSMVSIRKITKFEPIKILMERN